MDQCSQALNRGAQLMPSAENSLSIPAALSPDSRAAGICAPVPAYQNHTDSRLPFVHFAWKTAANVRKMFFFVRLCPFRTINIPKTNTLWERLNADCLITSLTNIQLSSSRLAVRKTTPLGALPLPSLLGRGPGGGVGFEIRAIFKGVRSSASLLDARQKWLCLRATRDGEKGPGDRVENMSATLPPHPHPPMLYTYCIYTAANFPAFSGVLAAL